MKWSILTISAPERQNDLDRLCGLLEHQIGDLDIEHVIVQGVGFLGDLRQQCIEKATGEYVNFIDDDDLVAHDYISTIYPLLDGVDYIGHRLQLYVDGEKRRPTFHTIRYLGWSEDAKGYYRGVDIKNPIRRELAMQCRFEGAYGEDAKWARDIEATCRPQTEHFIDRPMYFYFHSTMRTFANSGR